MSESYRDLKAYKLSFELAMDIYEITKTFPVEEKYALSDQLRRSSRSVSRAIAEGYRKRQYPNHFSSKMSDADMENSETQVSLQFAVSCKYLSIDRYEVLVKKSEEIGRMLYHMIKYPEKYQPRT